MSIESSREQRHETPGRIRRAAQAMLALFYSEPEGAAFEHEETENKDNIRRVREICAENPDAHFVVVANHWSNADGGAAAAKLGKIFDFQYVVDSSHYREGAPQQYMYGFLAGGDGKDRFTPITSDGRFQSKEFENLASMLVRTDRTAWMATHSWTTEGSMKKGKPGPVFLAHLQAREGARLEGKKEGYAYILPTAFNGGPSALEPGDYVRHVWNRPEAHYRIGRPLGLNPIDGFDELERRLGGEQLSLEEEAMARRAQEEMQMQADEVARAVSELLPEERRGPYRETALS